MIIHKTTEDGHNCFHGMQLNKGYLEYPLRDNSAISVGFWCDHISVKPHCHTYYEFSLIKKGTCTHNYKGTSVPLVPGDVYLITPHSKHSYNIQAEVEIYNCNFIAEGLGEEFNEILDELFRKDEYRAFYGEPKGNRSRQGILHLEPKEMETVEYHLLEMIREQDSKQINLEYAKSAHLQLILILFQRLFLEYTKTIEKYTDQKKNMIYEAVRYVNQHLNEKINFDDLARQSYVSTGYFRTIFKDVMGMRPIEYLNQLRVTKSLEFLESEKYSITEAGAKVGFSDPNYYSRIFKKIMGYSPKYFKNMQIHSD